MLQSISNRNQDVSGSSISNQRQLVDSLTRLSRRTIFTSGLPKLSKVVLSSFGVTCAEPLHHPCRALCNKLPFKISEQTSHLFISLLCVSLCVCTVGCNYIKHREVVSFAYIHLSVQQLLPRNIKVAALRLAAVAWLVRGQASQRFLVFIWQAWVYFGNKQEMRTVWYERGVSQCDASLLQ